MIGIYIIIILGLKVHYPIFLDPANTIIIGEFTEILKIFFICVSISLYISDKLLDYEVVQFKTLYRLEAVTFFAAQLYMFAHISYDAYPRTLNTTFRFFLNYPDHFIMFSITWLILCVYVIWAIGRGEGQEGPGLNMILIIIAALYTLIWGIVGPIMILISIQAIGNVLGFLCDYFFSFPRRVKGVLTLAARFSTYVRNETKFLAALKQEDKRFFQYFEVLDGADEKHFYVNLPTYHTRIQAAIKPTNDPHSNPYQRMIYRCKNKYKNHLFVYFDANFKSATTQLYAENEGIINDTQDIYRLRFMCLPDHGPAYGLHVIDRGEGSATYPLIDFKQMQIDVLTVRVSNEFIVVTPVKDGLTTNGLLSAVTQGPYN